jgi:hypothetical protein
VSWARSVVTLREVLSLVDQQRTATVEQRCNAPKEETH